MYWYVPIEKCIEQAYEINIYFCFAPNKFLHDGMDNNNNNNILQENTSLILWLSVVFSSSYPMYELFREILNRLLIVDT